MGTRVGVHWSCRIDFWRRERINEGLMTCANMDSANDKQSKATTTTMIVKGPRQHGLGATWLGEGGSPGYREYALSDLGR